MLYKKIKFRYIRFIKLLNLLLASGWELFSCSFSGKRGESCTDFGRIQRRNHTKQYNIIKEAMKAYTNKLMIGITTAGDNMTSFCCKCLQYCKKILDGTASDEAYFLLICKADEDENGDVDFTNPLINEMANPDTNSHFLS